MNNILVVLVLFLVHWELNECAGDINASVGCMYLRSGGDFPKVIVLLLLLFEMRP